VVVVDGPVVVVAGRPGLWGDGKEPHYGSAAVEQGDPDSDDDGGSKAVRELDCTLRVRSR
jgi:hypothetical protein